MSGCIKDESYCIIFGNSSARARSWNSDRPRHCQGRWEGGEGEKEGDGPVGGEAAAWRWLGQTRTRVGYGDGSGMRARSRLPRGRGMSERPTRASPVGEKKKRMAGTRRQHGTGLVRTRALARGDQVAAVETGIDHQLVRRGPPLHHQRQFVGIGDRVVDFHRVVFLV